MTSNTQFESSSSFEEKENYPIYTVRWLSIHALGVPTVWFIGAITAMQFIDQANFPKFDFYPTPLGLVDVRIALVLLPILASIAWNILLFGKPTLDELLKLVRS